MGRDNLSDAELIAVLLRTGHRGESVTQFSRRLLDEQGGLVGLSRLDPQWLAGQYPGLGPAKVCALTAAFEVGLRAAIPAEAPLCRDPAAAARYLAPHLGCLVQEEFHALYLDTRKRIMRHRMVSRGSLNQTIVQPADVFRPAVAIGCDTVLVAHNHPSGDTTPSETDIQTTARLRAAGAHLGIELVDHLIVSGGQWLSLRRNNPDLFR